mmetsp:Transcript_4390/g.5378  ORF Transcript_4390/g.5378 Transcript_4390/m.5378 type:complete len:83 (-) Transcript_4390:297-545(-)
MIVRPSVPSVCYTLEVVKVELALKRGELGLFKVLAHDLVFELAWAVDHEGPSMGEPGDDVLLTNLFNNFQDYLEFNRKGAAN